MYAKNIVFLALALVISYPASLMANSPHTVSVKHEKSEGNILGALIVVNKNEISVSNLAEQKTSNHSVKNFAQFMIKEHRENLQKAESISKKLGIKPIEGAIANKLKYKGKIELETLNKLQRNSFDKAYMTDMVKGHQNVLNLVNRLIQKSSNPLVKKYLETTKQHVQHHLAKAKAIRASLQ